jgi:predicted glycogen debranching enzyme
VFPDGYKYLSEFRLDPYPVWTFEIEGTVIEKHVFMVHGRNTTVCEWKVISGSGNVSLEIRPLLSFVDYHHLQREDERFDGAFTNDEGLLTVRPFEDIPELKFAHNAISVELTGFWYRDLEYAIEQERGFDFHESLFQPFSLTFDLSQPAVVIASTETEGARNAEKYRLAEVDRRAALVRLAGATDGFAKQLVLAADQFIVRRGEGYTILAGYPWFSDWGRDTMIALPGLTLSTNRPEIARGILIEFSKHVSQGMLPNRFPDAGETPDYNTVDATLWYFEAVRAYAEETGDYDLVQEELYPVLSEIFTWHLRSTRYNIHVDTDGLLYAGEPGHQLTWMDAKIGDLVITPRIGKPVEIQALWYNALRIMADLAERFGHDEDRDRFDAMADLAKLSFNGLFWNDEDGCLFDVVDNGTRDRAFRPNQIFAVSLAHPILNKDRWQQVVEKVKAELLTPFGLRSLSSDDAQYVPVYTGTPFERDSGYHQGTIWGWLIGPFIDAHRKTFAKNEAEILSMLSGFEGHLAEAGLCQISEIFDADPPHRPRGCPAQAWSVAEVLRALIIDR